MEKYLVLLRGINVGGKNKVPMADLKNCLENLGFSDISTYIASGNVLLNSDQDKHQIKTMIEQALPNCFHLDDEIVKVLVVSKSQLQTVIATKPEGFGEQPDVYHSDVIFLIDVPVSQVISIFNPREGVDNIWAGESVVYSQRLSSKRTKSRLNKIMSSPFYKYMTIRNWNTVTKLADMIS